ncbi:hypothetical protein EAF04_007245 [Stromatinia cepivora]|nr:hypothetical protein EAF04_007245 [Stromatinia cepivora]
MPDVLDRVEKAMPYAEMLLELYLSLWTDSKKRKLLIYGEELPNPKRQHLSLDTDAHMTQPQQPSTLQDQVTSQVQLQLQEFHYDTRISHNSNNQGVSGGSTMRDMNSSGVSHTESARQIGPIEDIHAIDGHIQAINIQRRIDVIYTSPQKEKLERCLDGPFLTAFENHQQSIMEKFPRDRGQDVEFSITIDRKAGLEMIRMFGLQRLTTKVGGRVQQYSKMPMENLSLLGPLFHRATIGSSTCKSVLGPVSAFISDDTDDSDIEFSIMVDPASGREMRGMFGWQIV